jgi:hypothetical protein
MQRDDEGLILLLQKVRQCAPHRLYNIAGDRQVWLNWAFLSVLMCPVTHGTAHPQAVLCAADNAGRAQINTHAGGIGMLFPYLQPASYHI